MKIIISLLLLLPVLASAGLCSKKTQTKICHAGSVQNPNFQEICVDFAALWGHFAHHPMDMYGECPKTLNEPYACNAGIRHLAPTTKICHQLDNNLSSLDCSGSKHCICSEANDEQYALDFMQFTFEHKDSSSLDSKAVQASRTYEYNLAFDEEELGIYKINTETLNFNLGSERVGSEYFIDICIENFGADASQNYDLDVSLTLADGVLSQSPYATMTDLKINTEIFCHSSLDNFSNVYDYQVYSTDFLRYPTGGMFLKPNISKNNFCVVRHSFKENEQLDHLRKWSHLNVNASSLIDIQDEDIVTTNPIEICHVKPVKSRGSLTYTCSDLSFINGENYIQYILQYNNVAAWRQDHQHDYEGRCESRCGKLNNGN
jgi:hypothetical protein